MLKSLLLEFQYNEISLQRVYFGVPTEFVLPGVHSISFSEKVECTKYTRGEKTKRVNMISFLLFNAMSKTDLPLSP